MSRHLGDATDVFLPCGPTHLAQLADGVDALEPLAHALVVVDTRRSLDQIDHASLRSLVILSEARDLSVTSVGQRSFGCGLRTTMLLLLLRARVVPLILLIAVGIRRHQTREPALRQLVLEPLPNHR